MCAVRELTRGSGLLNSAINALPFELHISGYQFCGPGTRLQEQLARDERGINPLAFACREHDIAYSRSNDLEHKHIADGVLANKARELITARNLTIGERVATTTVWVAIKA